MSKIDKLIEQWRDIGPADWSENRYGWRENGKPITLDPWQRAILDAWFAHSDDVTTLAISNVKKTGKTFVNAVLTCWRWLCLPSEHFVCGNDLDQSAGRQFRMIAQMVKKHPLLRNLVKITRTLLTFTPTDSTLAALAVDASGNAGSNHLTSSFTEAWGVIYESGIRAWEEMTPPPLMQLGFPALRIADSYAGWSGESTVWHQLVDAAIQGDRVVDDWPITLTDDGVLCFHLTGEEARRRCFRGTEKRRIRYYKQQRGGLRTNTFNRLHNNERSGAESSFLPSMSLWYEKSDPALFMSLEQPSELEQQKARYIGKWWDIYPEVVVAMDASTGGLVSGRGGDSTGIVVLRKIAPDKCAVVYVKEFRPGRDGLIDYIEIERTFNQILDRFNVVAVVFDPFSLADLYHRHKHEVGMYPFGQGLDRVKADTFLYTAISQGRVLHYGDERLDKHLTSCASKAAGGGDANAIRLVKKSPRAHIDLGVCLSMGVQTILNKLVLS